MQMIQRFSHSTRRVLMAADAEARSLAHHVIGTGHLLLALLRERSGPAAEVLASHGVSHEAVRARMEGIDDSDLQPSPDVPAEADVWALTARAKAALEAALREAIELGSDTVRAEHVLLALTRMDGGSAVELLTESGADPQRVRRQVLRLLSTSGGTRPPSAEDAEAVRYAPIPTIASDIWTTHDRLGFQAYADAVAGFIRHRDTRPPLTIGIKAPWGAGKTSLMRMVRDRLDPPVDPADVDRGVDGAWSQARRAGIPLAATQRSMPPGRRRRRHRHGQAGGASATASEAGPLTNGRLLRATRDHTRSTHAEAEELRADPPAGPGQPGGWRPTVWFNPWMYQSEEQIWAGLAHDIVDQITGRMAPLDRERFWMLLNLRRVDVPAVRQRVYRAAFERLIPVLLTLAVVVVVCAVTLVSALIAPTLLGWLRSTSAVLLSLGTAGTAALAARQWLAFLREKTTGPLTALIGAPDYAAGWHRLLDREANGAFAVVTQPDYGSRLGFLHLVRADIERVLRLVTSPERPLVVFVDDLDRCSPGTVAKVIEAVNLFLAGHFPNCVFVMAMEPSMVASQIEAAYGLHPATDPRQQAPGAGWSPGWRFLEKIVQLPLGLPSATHPTISAYMRSLLRSGTGGSPGGLAGWVRASQMPEPPSHAAEAPDAAEAGWVRILRQAGVVGEDDLRHVLLDEAERWLGDDSPEVGRLVNGYVPYLGGNPRVVKRFVNLFRFYAFVELARTSYRLPSHDLLDQVAKVAVLAIRWPHLRDALLASAVGGGPPGDTVLTRVERILPPASPVTGLAASQTDPADPPDQADPGGPGGPGGSSGPGGASDEAGIAARLKDAGLSPALCAALTEPGGELAALLMRGPRIGAVARGLL